MALELRQRARHHRDGGTARTAPGRACGTRTIAAGRRCAARQWPVRRRRGGAMAGDRGPPVRVADAPRMVSNPGPAVDLDSFAGHLEPAADQRALVVVRPVAVHPAVDDHDHAILVVRRRPSRPRQVEGVTPLVRRAHRAQRAQALDDLAPTSGHTRGRRCPAAGAATTACCAADRRPTRTRSRPARRCWGAGESP